MQGMCFWTRHIIVPVHGLREQQPDIGILNGLTPFKLKSLGFFLIVGTRCTNLLHGELMASSLV
jgi:hypothetical protein